MAADDGTGHPSSGDDVLRRLRIGTAAEHADVERTLDLLDPALDRARLTEVLARMHGFWIAAEAGLDAWAARTPADADDVAWTRRRRAPLFAADLRTLGHGTATVAPRLPAVVDTDEALVRLYVLEGSTLGGTFIDRHLASLPAPLRRPHPRLLPLRLRDRGDVGGVPAGDPRPRGRRRRRRRRRRLGARHVRGAGRLVPLRSARQSRSGAVKRGVSPSS
jgi:heme oxygenase